MTFKELVYEHKGLNYNRLSIASGVPVTTLHNFDKRKSFNHTNIDIVKKIADALDLTLDEIFNMMQE